MTTPYCQTHPDGYLQPGDTPAWHLTPAAQRAIWACHNRCPVPIEDCARDALTSGAIPGQAQPRVASGVIQAGVVCLGDSATHHALVELAYPNGGGPTYVATDADADQCAICSRALLSPLDEIEDPEREARRAVKQTPLCRACYKAAWRARTLAPTRPSTPEQCVTCNRPMSTRRKRLPGQVVHDVHGQCRACARAATRRATDTGSAAA